ncbi:MAG: TonB-dependent receptor [Bacteroidales bacterium]|nr:TonB-dependent receptor [Bacteroidales bacterium]
MVFALPICGRAQHLATVSGTVTGGENHQPLESVAVCNAASGLWTLTDERGNFQLRGLPVGPIELELRTIGYRTRIVQMMLRRDTVGVSVCLPEDNLKLSEVNVTAQRARSSETTTYTIDRAALEHTQLLSVSDVTALLPGGKSNGDLSLMSDLRIALRSDGSTEMGNTSFGTAVEVDGVRLNTNGQMALSGASTRTLAASNVERVEIVTGIPSVEYGDLSNGIVRVETRRGKTPWVIEGTVKPHTRMLSVSKGWQMHRGGMLNVNLERAKSFSNLTSPYTSYDRNVLSLNYSRRMGQRVPTLFSAQLSGNVGGYDSKSDPDNYLDTHSKQRDTQVRANVRVQWQLHRSAITSLEVWATGSYGDQKSTDQTYTSTAASLVQIHATDEGYYVAHDYDEDPTAAILLSPVGYWYRTVYTDSKPVQWSGHVKYGWHRALSDGTRLRVKAGADYRAEGNQGRGTYYEEMRTAPTWRESRYDTLPYQHQMSLYAEAHLQRSLRGTAQWSMTAGLREDMSSIRGSEYGCVSALSPRFSTRLTLWDDQERAVSSLTLHGGWGKSVKLPSYKVLYPSTTYSDQLAFAPGTMADGRSYYAYYCMPSRALWNGNLRWQYALQGEIGADMQWGGTHLSLSLYRTTTHRPYISTYVYRPYTYKYTGQSALEGCTIASADRQYSIDPQTGIVTVSDRTGAQASQQLAYTERQTYRGNYQYVNGSASTRQGIEWVIDLARIKALHTDVRIDGNAAFYRGIEHTLVQSRPSSTLTMANGQPYAYIGYYDGSSTVGNGRLSRQVNTNVTVTTHLPVVRLILSVKLETSLCHYSRNLQTDAIIPETDYAYTGTHSSDLADHYVLVYPKYYSTWDEPDRLIPFEEALLQAKSNDQALYQELVKLIEQSNTNYYFNGNRVSPYLAGHLNITKEIGDHVALSFQATNFWNNTRTVRNSQTNSESTLYNSGYIQSFYYGMKVTLKGF